MPPRPRRLRVYLPLEPGWTCSRPASGAPGRELSAAVPPATAGEWARYISALTCTGISAVHHRYTACGTRSSPARKDRVTHPRCRVSPVRIAAVVQSEAFLGNGVKKGTQNPIYIDESATRRHAGPTPPCQSTLYLLRGRLTRRTAGQKLRRDCGSSSATNAGPPNRSRGAARSQTAGTSTASLPWRSARLPTVILRTREGSTGR